jgi:hypothetical protein
MLYGYDQSIDPTNPDIRTKIGELLTPDAETGWTRIPKEIFIDVDTLPVGTVAVQIYYLEEGSEAEAHIMSDFKYENPTREEGVSSGQPRGNSWNVAESFPVSFRGYIEAVTTDADGVRHGGGLVKVEYYQDGAYEYYYPYVRPNAERYLSALLSGDARKVAEVLSGESEPIVVESLIPEAERQIEYYGKYDLASAKITGEVMYDGELQRFQLAVTDKNDKSFVISMRHGDGLLGIEPPIYE